MVWEDWDPDSYEEGLKKGRWQGLILAGIAGIIGAVIGMLVRIS